SVGKASTSPAPPCPDSSRATASSSRSSVSASATFIPNERKRRAAARPMPAEAPVMTATRPGVSAGWLAMLLLLLLADEELYVVDPDVKLFAAVDREAHSNELLRGHGSWTRIPPARSLLKLGEVHR